MEIIVLALFGLCVGMGILLYRQEAQLVTTRRDLYQRDADAQKAHYQWQRALNELSEKQTQMAKLDALVLKLRQDYATAESRTREIEQRHTTTQSLISNLRGQIQMSEMASVESKALFSTISSVAYDLVFVLNEDQIVIALNQAADMLFAHKNPIGDKLCEVIDSPDLQEIIVRAQTEDESLEEQIFYDGHHYRVRTQVMRYQKGHSFIGVALQDVSQLVRLNRSRRDMVANISHELRTPIANIRLIIDSLFYDQNRPKRKASIASLRAIARETDTLLWLVQELLDLSMIESGQAIMKLVPIRLSDVVNDAVERLYDQLEARGLKVVVHVPEKIVVLCDYEQTRRVLINLIHNAKKWSPMNDAITVSASIMDEEVTVSVFDNGPGVPSDQTERIFERFYQIDTSRSDGEGTGLGLAICKHIVEAHGGRIWAEGNTAGNGGRFLFTLLNAGMQTPQTPQLPEVGQHDGGLNALIASRYEGADEGEIELED
jgi:two-component system, OmpR family, phosphate regulon sensor histidine kinase PhoR